jgi:hypothetical protein
MNNATRNVSQEKVTMTKPVNNDKLIKKELTRLWRSALPLLPYPDNVHICILLTGENTYLSVQYGCRGSEIAFYRTTERFQYYLVPGAKCFVIGNGTNTNKSAASTAQVHAFTVPKSWVKKRQLP